MKEAILYKTLPQEKVKCFVCYRRCSIAKGKMGYCSTRYNENGKLYTLIYEKISSAASDAIEKKPLFHFHPGTEVFSLGTIGCNFRCIHCQNWQIAYAEANVSDVGLDTLTAKDAVQMAKRFKCSGMAWTYNEPTIWLEYTKECASLCKDEDLYTVYVTNGYTTFESLDAIGPVLDAYRVDIKGFTKEFYKKLANVPDFKPILKAAVRAKEKWNCHVEVVTNVIPTMNDDETQLRELAVWIRDFLGEKTPWHVTRFIPYLELKHLPVTPVKTLEWAREIGLSEGLKFVYLGNVPGHQAENTFCPKCGNEVISRHGFTVSHYDVEKGLCKYCGEELNIIE